MNKKFIAIRLRDVPELQHLAGMETTAGTVEFAMEICERITPQGYRFTQIVAFPNGTFVVYRRIDSEVLP